MNIPPIDARIRLLLQLDREDDPQLYDDLVRFRKGIKRVSRLRLLAHDGLRQRLEPAPFPTSDSGEGPRADNHPAARAPAAARLTNQAFDPPGDE